MVTGLQPYPQLSSATATGMGLKDELWVIGKKRARTSRIQTLPLAHVKLLVKPSRMGTASALGGRFQEVTHITAEHSSK